MDLILQDLPLCQSFLAYLTEIPLFDIRFLDRPRINIKYNVSDTII